MLASLVIKIEYRRTLHRGSKEPSRPGSLSCLPAAKMPPVSSIAAAFLPGLPRARFAKGSVCPSGFLPGSAQYVECDVNHSKQTTATFLPGSRIARSHAPTSLANAFSNRELYLLEPTLTHRKQTIAPLPNRELSTNPCFCNSALRSSSHSFTLTKEGPLATHPGPAFLTGSASRTESSVTHSKQTTATFLTGSRIARLLALSRCCERVDSVSNPHFSAPQNLMSHPRPIQIFLRPTI
jgi:hypothetical protein